MALFKLSHINQDYYEQLPEPPVSGWEVYATAEGKVGTVADALVNEAGRLRYLILETSFWILGRKKLLAREHLHLDTAFKRIYLQGFGREQLEALPDYTEATLPEPLAQKPFQALGERPPRETASHRVSFHPAQQREVASGQPRIPLSSMALPLMAQPFQALSEQSLAQTSQDSYSTLPLERQSEPRLQWHEIQWFEEQLAAMQPGMNFPFNSELTSQPMSSLSSQPEQRNSRIRELLERLRQQLHGFILQDEQGHIIGRVRDLMIDEQGHFNLIIYSSDLDIRPRLFLVSHGLIQKVDSSSRTLLVDLSPQQVTQLPEYQPSGQTRPEETTMLQEPMELQRNNLSADNPADNGSQVVSEEVVQLLEERLVVNHTRRKVGEVIVRKEVETHMVQVPVRRERLIVEQISPEQKQLAAIDLSQGELSSVHLAQELQSSYKPTVSGEFTSLETASQILQAIATQSPQSAKKIRIELVLEDPSLQEDYQRWLTHYSNSQ